MGRCSFGRGTCLMSPVFTITAREPAGFVERHACREHLSWLVTYVAEPLQSVVVARLD